MKGIEKVKNATVEAMCKYLVSKAMFDKACFDRRIIDYDTYNAALEVQKKNAEFDCGKTVIEEYIATGNENILTWNSEHEAMSGSTLHWIRELATTATVNIINNDAVKTLENVYLRPLYNAGLLDYYIGAHHFAKEEKTICELDASQYVLNYINDVISNLNH